MPFHPVVEEWDAELVGGDPLAFPGYRERLATPAEGESVRTGRTAAYAFIDSRFEVHGGTLGAAAGERIVRAYDRARDLRLPLVVCTRTGGARVQEGMVALAQLARVAAAAQRHRDAGLFQVGIYRSPTTGGVFATYASLADVRAAHPGAMVGFSGPRVAEATLGVRLPAGTHRAEWLYDHGLLDALVKPGDEAAWLEAVLGERVTPLAARPLPAAEAADQDGAWGEVLRARALGRPTGLDQAAALCESWVELRGSGPVVRAGLAIVGGQRGVVIVTDRYQADGRPRPTDYRLAQRAIGLASRLGLPVLTLVDTPGADPSPKSEADGLGVELAATFAAFASCPSPVVSVCVGEGGSGGALALSFADRLLMCEHAVFSVIAPEGAAAILKRDAARAPEVTDMLGLTADEVVELGVADAVVPDGGEGLRSAVLEALAGAVPGQRLERLDAATERWLVSA